MARETGDRVDFQTVRALLVGVYHPIDPAERPPTYGPRRCQTQLLDANQECPWEVKIDQILRVIVYVLGLVIIKNVVCP